MNTTKIFWGELWEYSFLQTERKKSSGAIEKFFFLGQHPSGRELGNHFLSKDQPQRNIEKEESLHAQMNLVCQSVRNVSERNLHFELRILPPIEKLSIKKTPKATPKTSTKWRTSNTNTGTEAHTRQWPLPHLNGFGIYSEHTLVLSNICLKGCAYSNRSSVKFQSLAEKNRKI